MKEKLSKVIKSLSKLQIGIGLVCTVLVIAVGVVGIAYATSNKKNDVAKEEEPAVLNEVAEEVAIIEPETTDLADNEQEIKETEVNAPEDVTPEPEEKTKLQYATSNLNVRDSASATGKKIGNIANGSEITVISTDGDWSVIEYEGTTAYVSSKYLSTEKVTEQKATADTKKTTEKAKTETATESTTKADTGSTSTGNTNNNANASTPAPSQSASTPSTSTPAPSQPSTPAEQPASTPAPAEQPASTTPEQPTKTPAERFAEDERKAAAEREAGEKALAEQRAAEAAAAEAARRAQAEADGVILID